MGQEPLHDTPDFRALKAALEEEWPQRTADLRTSGVFLNEGDGDGGGGGDGDGTGDGAGNGNGDGDGAGDGDGTGEPKTYDESYVKKLRDEAARHRREKQELSGRLQAIDDASKSDLQKLEERATTAEQRAQAAESSGLQLEVALDKAPEGMPIAQVRKLAKRLTGSTKEELEADAADLFADYAPTGQEPGTGGRPRERLRPGAAPGSEPEETDPAKLAAMVPRRI